MSALATRAKIEPEGMHHAVTTAGDGMISRLPASWPTARLSLSRLDRADADDLAAMLLKPGLYGYIGGAPQSETEARNQVERWTKGSPASDVAWLNYLARSLDDQRVIGLAQATVSLGGHAGECLLAYLVDPAEQGQGFGAEMMRGKHCGWASRNIATVAPAGTLLANYRHAGR